MTSHSDESNQLQKSAPNLLNNANSVKINDKFILKFPKQSTNVSKDIKNSCKALHFSSEWSFEEVLVTVERLDPKDFPHLFIFVISATKFSPIEDQVEKFKENLLKFGSNRPVLVQLTSEAENFSIFYYKEEHSSYFLAWYPTFWQSSGVLSNLPEFLNLFLNEKFENFENKVLNDISKASQLSIILRFLSFLNMPDNFFKIMILNMASSGTKFELLAALDVPFEKVGRIFTTKAYVASSYVNYITKTFIEESDPTKHQSVLLTAVKNQNNDVIDYLIDNWSLLLQELPFDHQVRISTVAFASGQLDVLCDLLDYADFPFPHYFQVESFEHERLEAIVAKKAELEAAIKEEKLDDILRFTEANSNLKVVYNTTNKSALQLAVNIGSFKVYNFLKLRSFVTTNPNENLKEFDQESGKFAVQQRNQNVIDGLKDYQKAVNSLCNRSLIHNKRISKGQEKQYRKLIRNWFEDINKIKNGPIFLDVAASCPRLKIIFDFGSETVENVSLANPNASGTTYPSSRWIFIGAKLSDKSGNVTKQHNQKIKGVLAHELCHYVMKLVYENQEKPYFKLRKDIQKKFKAIVKTINKWPKGDSKNLDDKCNGTISSVFKLYDSKDFHPELIVRVVQLLAEFVDSEEKLKHLQEKYKVLFEFWFNHVVPELQKYLQRNPDVERLNGLFKLLQTIQNLEFEPRNRAEIEQVTSSKFVVVQTNVPKLLLLDIYKNLYKGSGSLVSSQNIFVDPEKLKNQQILNDFKQVCVDNPGLRVIVDCSKEVPDDLKEILTIQDISFIIAVSNDENSKKVVQMCKKNKLMDVTRMELNYNWSNLTEESQKLMLETKVNFQNNSEVLLKDLLAIEENLETFFDDQILNLLLENQPVIINTNKDEEAEKLFKLQFQPRNFIKKLISKEEHIKDGGIIEKSKFIIKMLKKFFRERKVIKSQEELFTEVKNQQYVLISDYAGNGKSWTMKNIAKVLREQNPTKWVTYVDLKQFVDEFKAQKVVPEFVAFMVEQILKHQQPYELKIFQKLYNDGNVFILFDGFDEIAPNYAEIVSKLAQNFQQNGGNQMWIATRDYFEVDLKQKLKLNVAYSLEEMTEDEGVDMIARNWVLFDLQKKEKEPESKEKFDEIIKASPKYKQYQQKARLFIEKAKATRNNLIGLPQLFKMIADGFKDEENVDNIQGPKIYVEFIEILYKRWSRDKGQIREEANVKSQEYELSFRKFHQYQAILSMFPKLILLFSFLCDVTEWPEEEVIACGIMSKKDGKYYFIHETFREFLVVEAIAKAIRQKNVHDQVMKVVDQILTLDEFKIVRMFLLPILNEQAVLEKFKLKIENLIFNQKGFFGELFADNNDNLVDFAIEFLKTKSYRTIRSFLKTNFKVVIKNPLRTRMFTKFQNFLFEILETEDLKNLIINERIFHIIIKSNLEIEVFNNFATKTEERFDREFVRKMLSGLFPSNIFLKQRSNIFATLTRSSNLNGTKVQEFLTALEIFFSVQEIFELMNMCSEREDTVLQYCIIENHTIAFRFVGTEIAKYFAVNEFQQGFKEFLAHYDILNRNIFHYIVLNDRIDFHKIFWELLLKTFEDREELKNFIMQKDKLGINFLYGLISRTNNTEIIEFTLKFLKENFNKTQLQEIFINSNSWYGINILKLFGNLDQTVLQDILGDDFRKLYEINGKLFRNSKIGNLKRQFVDMIIVPIVRVNKNYTVLRISCKWFASRKSFYGILTLTILTVFVLLILLSCKYNTFEKCFKISHFFSFALFESMICLISILLFLEEDELHPRKDPFWSIAKVEFYFFFTNMIRLLPFFLFFITLIELEIL